jgi:hypothetical protein
LVVQESTLKKEAEHVKKEEPKETHKEKAAQKKPAI